MVSAHTRGPKMTTPKSNEPWYPTQAQLADPEKIERAFRNLLDLHYALEKHVVNLTDHIAKTTKPTTGPPPGSGPSDSMLLGLRVAPVDTSTLADGATLKFSKKNGNLQFS